MEIRGSEGWTQIRPAETETEVSLAATGLVSFLLGLSDPDWVIHQPTRPASQGLAPGCFYSANEKLWRENFEPAESHNLVAEKEAVI